MSAEFTSFLEGGTLYLSGCLSVIALLGLSAIVPPSRRFRPHSFGGHGLFSDSQLADPVRSRLSW